MQKFAEIILRMRKLLAIAIITPWMSNTVQHSVQKMSQMAANSLRPQVQRALQTPPTLPIHVSQLRVVTPLRPIVTPTKVLNQPLLRPNSMEPLHTTKPWKNKSVSNFCKNLFANKPFCSASGLSSHITMQAHHFMDPPHAQWRIQASDPYVGPGLQQCLHTPLPTFDTDRRTDGWTGRHSSWPALQANKQTRQVGKQSDRQSDRQIDRDS